MSGISYTMPRFQAIDQNGRPMVGATLYTYQNKTTTPHPTWKDKDQTAYNTNPIVLDARGEAVIWLDPEQVYTFVLRDWFGVLVWSQDDVSGGASQNDFAAPDGASMVGFIQEGEGAVPRTLLDKAREIPSSEDFGIKGDMGVDVTDGLKNALAYCLTLSLPSGKFLISDTLNLQNGQRIYGAGQGLTTVEMTDDSVETFRANGVSGVVLQDLHIKSKNTGIADGVRFYDCDDCTVRDCYIEDAGLHAISLDRSRGCRVINNTVTGGKTSGICTIGTSAIPSENHTIIGNICTSNSTTAANGAGIMIHSGSRSCVVSGNTVMNSKALGILVTDGFLNSISGNVVRYSHYSGIAVHFRASDPAFRSDRNVITGNVSSNNGEHGIVCQSQLSVANLQIGSVISGNQCSYNGSGAGGGKGIYLASGIREFVVSGNQCSYNGESGIEVTANCGRGLISSNSVQSNGSKGLASAAGIRIHDKSVETGEGTSGCFDIVISGNSALNHSGGQQQWGIEITSVNAANIRRHLNFTSGNILGSTSDLGVNGSGINVTRAVSSIDTDQFVPLTDDTTNLGSGSARWSTVYAATGTINTSDAREKSTPLPIDDAVLDAWGDVTLVAYQWLASIARKGAGARVHFGVVAQQIRDTFVAHGLDGTRYGLLCYDEWAEENVDSQITRSAGNRWGVRPDQCLFLEAAYQRRRCQRIEDRLSAAETQIGM